MPLIDDIRLDIGDDSGLVPSGNISSLHNLLSPTHPDTTPASPVNGALIRGVGASWGIIGSGNEGESLMVKAGSVQWDIALAALTGVAAGDLAGTYPNPLVVAISGAPVIQPLTGQVLVFDGSNYAGSGLTSLSETLSETLDLGNDANQKIFWADAIGAITHLEGPTDEVFKLASASGQNMELFAGDTLRVFISPTGTQLINSVDINTVRDGGGDGRLNAGVILAGVSLGLVDQTTAGARLALVGGLVVFQRGDGTFYKGVQHGELLLQNGASNTGRWSPGVGFVLSANTDYAWSNTNTSVAVPDTFMSRGDPGIIQIGATTQSADGTLNLDTLNANTLNLSSTLFGNNLILTGYLNVGGLTTASGGITSPGTGTNSEVFGAGATATNTGGLAVGNGAIASAVSATAIGQAVNVSAAAIGLGRGAVANVAGQFVVGSPFTPITDVYIGLGVINSSPLASITYHATGGLGTNIVGTSLVQQPGLGTGSATPSTWSVKTPGVAASGTGQQIAATRLTIDETLSAFTNVASYVGSVNTGKEIVNGANSSSNYIVVETEDYMTFVQASGAIVVLNAAPEMWETHVIKDAIGAAAGIPIEVFGSGDLIDGAASVSIAANWAAITVVYNGTFWGVY